MDALHDIIIPSDADVVPAEGRSAGDVDLLLQAERTSILEAASAALNRSKLSHYQQAGQEIKRERLGVLLDLVISSIARRDLVPIVEHAAAVADERFNAGFDIGEVQCAFHVLEEAMWGRVVALTPGDRLVESIGLVSTVLGAARDTLARTYVACASKEHVPSLDLTALFRGGR